MKLMFKNCFFCTIDLKNAYYTIPVHPAHKKYLKFSFQKQTYCFNCLPFGLATAPWVFTKILKPVLARFRSQGITLVIYLDDCIILGKNYEECLRFTNIVKSQLEDLGFVINEEKSHLHPSQTCKFLGFVFNSKNMTLSLPAEKRKSLLKECIKFRNCKSCSIRKFAMFIGKLISACPALDYSWLYTKNFENIKNASLALHSGNFDALMCLPESLEDDFSWWLNNLPAGYRKINRVSFSLEIFSDASLSGWGACCNNESIHGFWNSDQRKHNIHFLELLAAFNALKSFCKHLTNTNILLRIDNTTSIAYINKMGGSRFRLLNDLTRQIWIWCQHRNLFIFASYINTTENVLADRESRSTKIDTEYQLNIRSFNLIVSFFGTPTVDLFASQANAKCDKYISWFKDPDCYAVDAFTIYWGNDFFYAFPPFAILTRVLQKIIEDKACGILIVPLWESQPWYPIFLKILRAKPIVLHPEPYLIFTPFRQKHPLHNQLSLVAGNVSGHLF